MACVVNQNHHELQNFGSYSRGLRKIVKKLLKGNPKYDANYVYLKTWKDDRFSSPQDSSNEVERCVKPKLPMHSI